MGIIRDLPHNPKNPRKASPEKLSQLDRSMREFGDLSGIVFNTKTNQLVGGHQRTKNMPEDSLVTITKRYEKPSETGTIAIGYIKVGGERYHYREVSWSKHKEMAANIAANKGAGDWDVPQLTEWIQELGSFDVDFDLDLTMFDELERKQFEPVEKFIAEEHWTENFEPPEGQFKFIVTILDEKRNAEFLKRLGVKEIKKKTGRVWSIHWPPEK